MAYQPTHYHSSKGLTRIEDMNPSHLRASAAKMEREGPKGDISAEDHTDSIAHMRNVADRKEQEFEANYLAEHGTPYVRKADRT